MNGRLGIDKGVGGYTRMGTDESSVIDYVIGSPELFDAMHDFQIGVKIPESNHLPMIFSLMCSINEANERWNRVNWDKQWKYKWSEYELPNVKLALCDELSFHYHSKILEALSERECTKGVAVALNTYIEQACKRACHVTRYPNKSPKSIRRTRWYDKKCRIKRSQAVKAGERIVTSEQRVEMLDTCKEYWACKQRKKRAYKNAAIAQIEQSFAKNSCDMWHALNSVCNSQMPPNQPEAREFYEYFLKTSETTDEPFLNKQLEYEVKAFLDQYDDGEVGSENQTPLEMEILN